LLAEVHTLSLHDALPICSAPLAFVKTTPLAALRSCHPHPVILDGAAPAPHQGRPPKHVCAHARPNGTRIVWPDGPAPVAPSARRDRKSTRLNSSHVKISY